MVHRRVILALSSALVAIAISTAGSAWVERSPLTPAVANVYPVIPSFNSQRLNQQLQLYRQYLLAVGLPDILIVGSSRSLQGVDPVVLQRALAARGYGELKIYNFGVNGATAQVVDLVLRQVLLPEQLPPVIIWGDGLRAFNSGRPDATYISILSSSGYRQVQQGRHPLPNAQPVQPPQPEERRCIVPRFLADTEMLRDLGCQRPRAVELQPSPPQLSPLADLEVTGFRRVAQQFQPTTYFRQFPRVPGTYDGDYVPFQLQGTQLRATQTLARYIRQQQRSLVLVSLPLSREYMDAPRARYEHQFQQRMQTIAQQEGIIWRDWSTRWANEAGYFADPSHLNQYGAAAVANALAADSAIPWSALLQR